MRGNIKEITTKSEEEPKEIANSLNVSINTINTHRQNILLKLKANNSIEAVNIAQRLGLLNSSIQ